MKQFKDLPGFIRRAFLKASAGAVAATGIAWPKNAQASGATGG